MKSVVIMRGVRTLPEGDAAMLERGDDGRLYVNDVDLFDLLLWVEKNPLTQFRQLQSAEKFEPSDQFKHLFDAQGNVL